MGRKDKNKFWVCALVLSLACIALLSAVSYALFVHAESATPDTYSGQASTSKVFVQFTVQGAKFISSEAVDTWDPNYYLEAPIGSAIYVSASATPSQSAAEGGLYALWLEKIDFPSLSSQPEYRENFAQVNGTGSLLASGTTTKIYDNTEIIIEWDSYTGGGWTTYASIGLRIEAPSSSPSPSPTSATTVLATTDNGGTVNLGLSGNISSSQMSNVRITTNQGAATTTVSFTVTGESGTTGSSTVAIPYSAVPYGTKPIVYIDNNPAQYLVTQDDVDQLFFVLYDCDFSTHQVSIVFTTTPDNTLLPSQNPATSPEQTSASTSPDANSTFAGLTFLIIIGIIVVIVIVVVVLVVARPKTGNPQSVYPYPSVPYQAQQQIVYSCPNCGSPLIFIPQYQRYYCQKENRYI